MRLQSVALFGFKSFADRTEVKILPGITAIVGPNGCGKSNVADALRWALGEQSPKALRGHRMEDVIFHGSGSRRPQGLAEVALTFSNDGELAVPWAEVSVGRRLYRDGESEYLLNKTACRLKDVHELFLGTGVNPKAYALMEQERLAHILTAKPLDRRVFVEEAAGITRYKQQRGETLAKLEATRQNLTRVKDVMDEVRRQLASLERQAKKAKAYKELQAERRSLEVSLAAAQHAALGGEAAGLSERGELEAARLEDLRTRVSALGAAQEVARADAMAAEHRAADVRHALGRAELELEGVVARAGQLRQLETELGAERARLLEEAEGLGRRLRTLAEERAAKAALLTALGAQFTAVQARATAEEAGLEDVRRALRAAREEAEARRREQVGLAGRRSELGQALGALEERSEQLGRRLQRVQAEHAQADAEVARLGQGRAEVETRLASAMHQLGDLGRELDRLAGALAAATAARAAAVEAAEAGRLDLAVRRSSLQALRDLEAQRDGYGRGPRAVFAAARAAELPGIVGSVADLLEVPPELERAVEAALGERLQWVVVDTLEVAKRALGYLGDHDGGQATFLPLSWLNGGPAAHVNGTDGVVGVASSLVTSSKPGLVANLLGAVVVVRDLAAAERLWSANGADTAFVTIGGEVLTPPGALGGGRASGGADASLLARKRAIRDLVREVEALEAGLGQALERVRAADDRLMALGDVQRAAASGREQAEAERLSSAKDLEQVSREQERVRLVVEAARAEQAQVDADLAEAGTELQRGRDELAAVAARAAEAADDVQRLVTAIEAATAREAAGAQAFLDAQVELASLAGRTEATRTELERITTDEAEARERITGGEERQALLASRLSDGRAEAGRLAARADEVRGARDLAERRAREAADELGTTGERLRGLGDELRGAETELGRSTQAAHETAVRLAEVRVRLEELLHDVRRRYEVDPEELAAAHDPARDPDQARARLEAVSTRIAALEPVNLIADDEYRELDERLTFLRAQHDDLAASMKDLERALRGMTRTAQARFLEAFEAINRHFQEIFTRLFEGGRAELRLVEAEEGGDPLDTGIEMVAQPRGKRLQAISLLSGGEKALTGLALLFAIFYYRPSPFCLLDEVDAPLDDANIHRFTRVLRELSGQTQFIVITHNRKTMEAADVLYGVTMEEPGLSRLVSVNLA